MDIDRLLTVEERKEDVTGSLKTGRTRGVRCAGACLRAINGTLHAAFRFVAEPAAQSPRTGLETLPHHPGGAAPAAGQTMERRATSMQSAT
ncbi:MULTISPECIES: hypothetical protein [Burkholderia]|uniref:hypothetical protein n=1 Tax=Burkholderia TaxID=32008 RepID=UPI001269E22C|nr:MULTISPECIES: hypothetical protein [Burkholderia]